MFENSEKKKKNWHTKLSNWHLSGMNRKIKVPKTN